MGDLTPHCGVSPEEKHRREDEAMKQIAELTGIAGDRMYHLYKVQTYILKLETFYINTFSAHIVFKIVFVLLLVLDLLGNLVLLLGFIVCTYL